MEKESTLGKMEKCMMENGIKDLSKDMEFGKESKMIVTQENGLQVKHMAMVFILGLMEIGTKDNGTCA